MHHNKWIDECCDTLERDNLIATDAHLGYLIKLRLLSNRIGNSISEDQSGFRELPDEKLLSLLQNGFLKELSCLERNLPQESTFIYIYILETKAVAVLNFESSLLMLRSPPLIQHTSTLRTGNLLSLLYSCRTVISSFLDIPTFVIPHLSMSHFGLVWVAIKRIVQLYALPSFSGWEKLTTLNDSETWNLLRATKDRVRQLTNPGGDTTHEVSDVWQYFNHVLRKLMSELQRENQHSFMNSSINMIDSEDVLLDIGAESILETWNDLSGPVGMEDFGFSTSMFDPFTFP